MNQHCCTVIRFPVGAVHVRSSSLLPRRRRNLEYRNREYLTEEEVGRLLDADRSVGRHRHRYATLIMLAYRHGLRVTKLARLHWDQIDFGQVLMHVRRVKRGTPFAMLNSPLSDSRTSGPTDNA